MASEALKNQNPTKRSKPMNIGSLLEAANEIRRALETIEHADPITFARIVASAITNRDLDQPAIQSLTVIADAYVEEALGRAIADAAELCAEISGGVRPDKSGRRVGQPDSERRREIWGAVRKVLLLKRWPPNAVDEACDVASDLIDEGEYGHLFGEVTADAEEIEALASIAAECHGCPDEHRRGTETDPRGFPGKLCDDCHCSAVHDVENGTCDLAQGWIFEVLESGIRTARPAYGTPKAAGS